jgi:hypothetical protein
LPESMTRAASAACLLAMMGCAVDPIPPIPGSPGPAQGTPAIDGGGQDGPGFAPQADSGRAAPAADSGGSPQVADSGAGTPAPDSGTTPPPNAFSCSAAGIAAYADSLVVAARVSCTADGVGVVDDTDYTCMQAPILQLNPPNAAASYNIVSTLLAGNTQFPFYECTYFVQTVTAGVCGTPISPPGAPWTSYPLAYTFAGQTIPGYTWIASGQGTVQVGDIPVYQSTYPGDPGHIMIVAAVLDSATFRLAEANELTSDGLPANMETGVVSNTRVGTLDDPLLAGWFRLNDADAGAGH